MPSVKAFLSIRYKKDRGAYAVVEYEHENGEWIGCGQILCRALEIWGLATPSSRWRKAKVDIAQ